MKMQFLPMILALALFSISACNYISPYTIYVIPLTITGCTIDVFAQETAEMRQQELFSAVFYTSQNLSDPLSIINMYDVGEGDEFVLPDIEDIVLDAEYNVRSFTFVDGKWYFEILADGHRRAVHYTYSVSDGSQFTEHHKDITDNGWVWVGQNYVESDNLPNLECQNTGEVINLLHPNTELLERLYSCHVDMLAPQTPGRVGPGENRNILAYIPQNPSGFGVSGTYTDDNYIDWYELDVPELGFVWVLKSHTRVIEVASIERPDPTECPDGTVNPQSPPPIVPITEDSTEHAINDECDDFVILSPLGTVPTGTAEFKWTEIERIDEYSVMFYGYTSILASQFTVNTNSLTVNTGELPTGSQLSWEVFAIHDDEIYCRTDRSETLTRQAEEIVIVETEEPEPDKKRKKKKDDGGDYTPPDGDGDA